MIRSHRTQDQVSSKPTAGPRVLRWLLFVSLAAPAFAQDKRLWTEVGYGISLTPPPNTVQAEGKAVTWVDPRGFSVSFEIVYSDTPVTLMDMTKSALVQMGFAQATPRMLDADGRPSDSPPVPVRLGDRPAVRMYFSLDRQEQADSFFELLDIDPAAQTTFFYGQAIVMLEPHAAALIKLTALAETQEPGRAAFEAVLDSLKIPQPDELNATREQRVDTANTWLQTTSAEAWAQALPRDQWFRLVQGDRELGHVRVRSSRDAQDLRRFDHEPPGTVLVVERREYLDGFALDVRSVVYAHDDARREVWETKTTVRPGDTPVSATPGLQHKCNARAVTWAETGVRGDQQVTRPNADGRPVARKANIITVITEAPPPSAAARQIEAHERFTGRTVDNDLRGRVDAKEYVAPDRSYLSQLQVWALGAMLPAEPAVYCFSAYHPPSGRPGLRTVEVQPQADGGRVVLDRPTSKLSPTRWVYDADGQLVERVSPQGVRLVPTTPDELATLWGIQPD